MTELNTIARIVNQGLNRFLQYNIINLALWFTNYIVFRNFGVEGSKWYLFDYKGKFHVYLYKQTGYTMNLHQDFSQFQMCVSKPCRHSVPNFCYFFLSSWQMSVRYSWPFCLLYTENQNDADNFVLKTSAMFHLNI